MTSNMTTTATTNVSTTDVFVTTVSSDVTTSPFNRSKKTTELAAPTQALPLPTTQAEYTTMELEVSTEASDDMASPGTLLTEREVIMISAFCGIVALVLLVVVIVCCCRKLRRSQKENRSRSRSQHQKLCATDSGTVSVSVNRMAGASGALAPSSLHPGPSGGASRGGTPSGSRGSPARYSPSQYSPGSRKYSCFTLSSSFETGLDLDGPPGYQDRSTPYLDRKGSTYDNVDPTERRVVMAGSRVSYSPDHQLRALSERQRGSLYQPGPRRSSKTLPLNFNMFNATRHSAAGHVGPLADVCPEGASRRPCVVEDHESDEDPDYANIPKRPPKPKSLSKRTSVIQEAGPSSKAATEPNRPSSKKFRGRRGSKSLELFINRKIPPVLSKIQRQVLEAVPIFGEPTPGTTPKTPPLESLEFPPPPNNPPPVSPGVHSCVNPMYSPTTATAVSLHSQNSYFSV